MSSAALEAVDRVLNRGGEPLHVLRVTARALVERGCCAWASIRVEVDDELAAVAHAGDPRPETRLRVPVVLGKAEVGELTADGCSDRALLERVALLVSPYCRSAGEVAREGAA